MKITFTVLSCVDVSVKLLGLSLLFNDLASLTVIISLLGTITKSPCLSLDKKNIYLKMLFSNQNSNIRYV